MRLREILEMRVRMQAILRVHLRPILDGPHETLTVAFVDGREEYQKALDPPGRHRHDDRRARDLLEGGTIQARIARVGSHDGADGTSAWSDNGVSRGWRSEGTAGKHRDEQSRAWKSGHGVPPG